VNHSTEREPGVVNIDIRGRLQGAAVCPYAYRRKVVSEPKIDLALVFSVLPTQVCEFGRGGDMRFVYFIWTGHLSCGGTLLEG
jgi:hypothetical protein